MKHAINEIKFSINEGAISFSFKLNNEEGTAYLQLPDTGDSQHTINSLEESEFTDKERDIYKQLERFYFDSFKDTECAAASAITCANIEHVEEIDYNGHQIFVAFDDEDNEHILVESAYKDYYNKRALFDLFEHHAFEMFGYDESYSEAEMIKIARDKMED